MNNKIEVSKASQINWEKLFELSEKLFHAKNSKYRGSSYKRKAAAVAIHLATYGGLQWGDLIKISWDDIYKVIQGQNEF